MKKIKLSLLFFLLIAKIDAQRIDLSDPCAQKVYTVINVDYQYRYGADMQFGVNYAKLEDVSLVLGLKILDNNFKTFDERENSGFKDWLPTVGLIYLHELSNKLTASAHATYYLLASKRYSIIEPGIGVGYKTSNNTSLNLNIIFAMSKVHPGLSITMFL